MVIYKNALGIDLCTIQGENKREKSLESESGSKYDVTLCSIVNVLGEVPYVILVILIKEKTKETAIR